MPRRLVSGRRWPTQSEASGKAGVPGASGDDLADVIRHWEAYERFLDSVGGQIGGLDVGDWSGPANEMFEQHRVAARRRMLAASDNVGAVRAVLVRWERDLSSARAQQREIAQALASAPSGTQAELTLLERDATLRAYLDTRAADTAAQLRQAISTAPRTSLFTDPRPPRPEDLTSPPPRHARYLPGAFTDNLTASPAKTALSAGDTGHDAVTTSSAVESAASSPVGVARPPLEHSPADFSTVSQALAGPVADGLGSASASSPLRAASGGPTVYGPAQDTAGNTLVGNTIADNNVNGHNSEGNTGNRDDAGGGAGGEGAGRRRWWVTVDVPTGDGIHDTLSRVADRELGDPNRWPEIYALNHGRPQQHYGPLQDPNLIHPGWALEIQSSAPPPDQPAPGTGSDRLDRSSPSGTPGCTPSRPDVPVPPAHAPSSPPVRHEPGHSGISTTGALIGLAVAATIVGGLTALHKTTSSRGRGGRDHTHNPERDGDHGSFAPSVGSLAEALRDRSHLPATNRHRPHSRADDGFGTDPWARSFPPVAPQPARPAENFGRPNLPQPSNPISSGTDTGTEPADTDDIATSEPSAMTVAPAPSGLCRALGVGTHSTQHHTENGDTDSGYDVLVDLAAVTGLGLLGPGTPDALRAALVELLTPYTAEHPVPTAHVLIPAEDAHTLLGIRPQPDTEPDTTAGFLDDHGDPVRLPAGLRVVTDLPAALDELEIEISRRLRTHLDPTPTGPGQPGAVHGHQPLVLIAALDADIEAHGDRRLQSVLDHGASLGIAAILTGSWVAGTTCHLDDTATITHATGPAAHALRETTLFTMPTQHALDALDIFAQLDNPEPSVPSGLSRDHTDTPHDITDHDSDDAPGQELNAIELALNPVSPEISQSDDPVAIGGSASEADQNSTQHGDARTDELNQPDPIQAQAAGASLSDAPVEAKVSSATIDVAEADPEERDRDESDQSIDVVGQNTDTAPLLTAPIIGHRPLASVPPEARIVVYAFGGLHVHARMTNGTALSDITMKLSPTQRKLLACLAASTRPVPADTLIDTCWPGPPTENALSKLHTAIYRLRAVLRREIDDAIPALLVHQADRYELDHAHCWIDHHAFYEQLRIARTATTPETQAEALRTVIALYTGTLLDGDDDIDWLDVPRAHALRETTTAAATLADHLTTNDPEQAVRYLTAALAIDPHNETTARELIRLQLTLGHSAAADRTYNTLAERLDELGARPEPATTHLLQPNLTPNPEPRHPAR